MGLSLTDWQIKSLTNGLTFNRGLDYFRQGRASVFENSGDLLFAKVKGSKDEHSVNVKYNQNNKVIDLGCSCNFFTTTEETCKHIVCALLQASQDNREMTLAKSEGSDKFSGYFISELVRQKPLRKHVARVEAHLRLIKSQSKGILASLEFKIGTAEKMYIMRDVYKFLSFYTSAMPMEFGKSFVYKYEDYSFSPPVLKLFEYFKGILDFVGINELFPGDKREIVLNTRTIKESLKLLKEIPLTVTLDAAIEHIKISEAALPLEVNFSKILDDYKMSVPELYQIYSVCGFSGCVLYKNILFILPYEQTPLLHILLDIYKNTEDMNILFKDEAKSAVVLNVFPRLRPICKLNIDEGINDDVILGKLVIKAYIDISDDGFISARVLFCYGNREINHFAGETIQNEDKIIVRDRKSENDFIYFASKAGFYPESGILYINNPEKTYEFFSLNINKLKDIAEVYLSDRVMNLKVHTPARSTGAVTFKDNNLLEYDFGFDEIPKDELFLVLRSLREKKKYHRLKDGSFVDIEHSDLKTLSSTLDALDVPVSKISGTKITLPAFRAFYIDSIKEDLNVKLSDSFEKYLFKFKNLKKEELPGEIKGEVRPYQLEGYKWFRTLYSFGFGGILADEMGLGKTLQAISFIASIFKETKMPSLIVVPTSLIFNWQSEFVKFAPSLKVKVVYGTPLQRQAEMEYDEDVAAYITSYGLLRRDLSLYANREFASCFVDEAQHIKNPNTISSKAVKSIKSKGFFALTGTPIENSLAELWSIFDFIMPLYLYTHHKFRKMYEAPIMVNNDKQALERLLKQIRPFILRRQKKDVLKDLPEKIESYMHADLDPDQKILYAAYLDRAKRDVDLLLQEDGGNHIQILSIITRLRQLCCHPSLFIEDYSGSSGKLEMFIEIIEDAIASGKRILVFSQFTSMLKIISSALFDMEINHFYLDGSVTSQDRMNMANAFNEGENSVFLISLKAGGTGLNLTGADTVIHFDLWWNPAVQNQATDRAHRIGQTKAVQVIKLVTKGTIEDKILELQEKKQAMTDKILEDSEVFIGSLSKDEIRELFEI